MSAQQHTPGETGSPRRAAPTIMVVTAVLGGVVLAGIGLSTAVQGFWEARSSSTSGPAQAEVGVSGVTDLEVDAGSGELTIRFADVDVATIETEGGDHWQMRRDGSDLIVESRGTPFNFCLGWCGDTTRRATVTLPRELEERGLGADLSLGAGSLTVTGDFRSIELEVGAGEALIEGSAGEVVAEVSAGRLDADLADVRQASFSVSAGGGDVRLSGDAPSEVRVDVSAGSLALQLPDAAYNVQVDSAAGEVVGGVRTDPDSEHLVTGDVSAGSLVLSASS